MSTDTDRLIPVIGFVLLLLLLLLLGAGVVHAQTPAANLSPADRQRIEQFRGQIEQATQALKAQKYDAAIKAFEAAYAIEPKPLILFNIGQTYRKAGQVPDALTYYERYLREDPQSEIAPKVQEYVTVLRESLKSVGTTTKSDSISAPSDNFQGSEEERAVLFRQSIIDAAKSYETREYEAAAASYWTAYSLKPHPSILFNVAQSYRKAEHLQEALSLYQRYVRELPDSPTIPEAQGHIVEIQEKLNQQKTEADRQLRERLNKAEQAVTERLADVERIEHQIDVQRKQSLAARPKPKPLYRRGWFLGTLVAGVAATGLTIGLAVGLSSRQDTDFGTRMLNF